MVGWMHIVIIMKLSEESIIIKQWTATSFQKLNDSECVLYPAGWSSSSHCKLCPFGLNECSRVLHIKEIIKQEARNHPT